jgi:hypothetical protein
MFEGAIAARSFEEVCGRKKELDPQILEMANAMTI